MERKRLGKWAWLFSLLLGAALLCLLNLDGGKACTTCSGWDEAPAPTCMISGVEGDTVTIASGEWLNLGFSFTDNDVCTSTTPAGTYSDGWGTATWAASDDDPVTGDTFNWQVPCADPGTQFTITLRVPDAGTFVDDAEDAVDSVTVVVAQQ